MTDQVQLRGGTTGNHTSFVGLQREVTVDTTKKVVVVHDGLTPGGTPMLRQDLNNLTLTPTAADSFRASLAVPGRNLIDNAQFNINQSLVSGTVALGVSTLGHDRFYAGGAGCTYTFAESGPITTLTILAGSLTTRIYSEKNEGGSHVLSWVGSSQARVNGGLYMSSPIPLTLTVGTDTVIEFGIGTVSKPKLETGTAATPFQTKDLSLELNECRRHFYRSPVFTQYNFVGSTFNFSVLYPTALRSFPATALVFNNTTNVSGQVLENTGAPRTAVVSATRESCTVSVTQASPSAPAPTYITGYVTITI